jgi:hypothetical protein
VQLTFSIVCIGQFEYLIASTSTAGFDILRVMWKIFPNIVTINCPWFSLTSRPVVYMQVCNEADPNVNFQIFKATKPTNKLAIKLITNLPCVCPIASIRALYLIFSEVLLSSDFFLIFEIFGHFTPDSPPW